MELLKAGKSYDQIAHELGFVNRSGAWKAVQRALDSHEAGSVEEYRFAEGQRLDALQSAVWEQAMSGDTKAIDLVLRIIERRVRLFGLAVGKPGGKRPPVGVVVSDEWLEHNSRS